MVEPVERVAARNLFSKDRCRAALADEIEPDGPEVALVFSASAFSGAAEWLAGAGTCPNRSVIWPSGQLQRI
jgi:hypothetical protein